MEKVCWTNIIKKKNKRYWNNNEDDCLPCPDCGECLGGGWVLPIEGCWSQNANTEPYRCDILEACPGAFDEYDLQVYIFFTYQVYTTSTGTYMYRYIPYLGINMLPGRLCVQYKWKFGKSWFKHTAVYTTVNGVCVCIFFNSPGSTQFSRVIRDDANASILDVSTKSPSGFSNRIFTSLPASLGLTRLFFFGYVVLCKLCTKGF